MKIVHRFRIMIDVFVFDVCLIRAKTGSEMMLFARMSDMFCVENCFYSGENGAKYDGFRPNERHKYAFHAQDHRFHPALGNGMMLSVGWKQCRQ